MTLNLLLDGGFSGRRAGRRLDFAGSALATVVISCGLDVSSTLLSFSLLRVLIVIRLFSLGGALLLDKLLGLVLGDILHLVDDKVSGTFLIGLACGVLPELQLLVAVNLFLILFIFSVAVSDLIEGVTKLLFVLSTSLSERSNLLIVGKVLVDFGFGLGDL